MRSLISILVLVAHLFAVGLATPHGHPGDQLHLRSSHAPHLHLSWLTDEPTPRTLHEPEASGLPAVGRGAHDHDHDAVYLTSSIGIADSRDPIGPAAMELRHRPAMLAVGGTPSAIELAIPSALIVRQPAKLSVPHCAHYLAFQMLLI